ncbi:MAG: NUDIX domain-containing protein [Candidatus Moranbacteria bacterium]|nr:NUDIX domain-containing protein [Candidatus Moranbacteria bacterium]
MNKIKCKNNFDQIVELPSDQFVFRPSAYGIILDKGEAVFMKNKSTGKLWFPGGGVEIGETLEEALKREIMEETGLEVEVGEMVFFKENFFYYEPLDEAYHAFLFFFICKAKNKSLSDSTDLESKNPKWIKIKEIGKDQLSDLSDDLYGLLQKIESQK